MRFFPLRRLQKPGSGHSFGFTSPEYAAPSGFLNLLTLSSTRPRSALFHAESVLGVVTPRGFPLPVAATTLIARCPSSFGFLTWNNLVISSLSTTAEADVEHSRDPETIPTVSSLEPLRRTTHRSGILAPGRSVHSEAVLP